MNVLNVEIKARCNDPAAIREKLLSRKAEYLGKDHQIDTYFQVPNGRFKLREGNIENSLIFYQREDIAKPKLSEVIYYQPRKSDPVKEQLSRALGVLVVVDKQREIYFIGNVKFHIDIVQDLGSFVEIEAIAANGRIGVEKLHAQCREYLDLFEISEDDLLSSSYSDLLLDQKIRVRWGTIEEAVELSLLIPEFVDVYAPAEYERRFLNRDFLLLIAEYEGEPAGFLVGHSTDDFFYSWLAGVVPKYRRKGIMDRLFKFQEQWCRENNFKHIRLKTRNKYKSMLHFAISWGFHIVHYDCNNDIAFERIIMEKKL